MTQMQLTDHSSAGMHTYECANQNKQLLQFWKTATNKMVSKLPQESQEQLNEWDMKYIPPTIATSSYCPTYRNMK